MGGKLGMNGLSAVDAASPKAYHRIISGPSMDVTSGKGGFRGKREPKKKPIAPPLVWENVSKVGTVGSEKNRNYNKPENRIKIIGNRRGNVKTSPRKAGDGSQETTTWQ